METLISKHRFLAPPQIPNTSKTIGQDEKRRLNFPRFLISIRVETVWVRAGLSIVKSPLNPFEEIRVIPWKCNLIEDKL